MIDKKGIIHNTSFSIENLEKWEYINRVAEERFGGNVSMAIMDAVSCHQKASEVYGDWTLMKQRPHWL